MVARIWQAHTYVSYPIPISHTFLSLEGRRLVLGEPEGDDLGFVFFWPVRATYRPAMWNASNVKWNPGCYVELW
jgi:hypothetical protein